MKKLLWAVGLTLGLLLSLIVLTAAMTTSQYVAMVPRINRLDTVPVELVEPIKQAAGAHGLPWTDVAAYLQLRFQYNLPIPTRVEIAESYGIEFGSTVHAGDVEQMWRESARQWIEEHLAEVGTDLERLLPESQRETLRTISEAIRTAEEARTADTEGWHTLTEGETYRVVSTLLDWPYTVPVEDAQFADDWGAPRPQNQGYTSTRHHGTDLFAPRWTPVRSAGYGVIEEMGWDYLGGWTVTVRDDITGVWFYYAHLEGYAPGLEVGSDVVKGEVLGFVGTSGEGPEGTHDVIAEPHLHFGIRLPEGWTNPYPYLIHWQEQSPGIF